MGQIKNIKLHIVTDIKKLSITQTQVAETKCVSRSVTSAHLQCTQDMEFHSSETTARCSNSVVVSVIKRLKQREIHERFVGPKHSGNRMERNWQLTPHWNLK